MVLEAVVCCADNSEWARNGDFIPSRFQAQNETIVEICRTRLDSNQESVVGVLSMAGKRIQTHVTLTREIRSVMNALAEECKIDGHSNFLGALKTAQLVLKNLQNKNQNQRIIMFVCSPVPEAEKDLVKTAKLLKKNNVSVDIVNFGDEDTVNENSSKLQAFIDAVNSSDASHLVNVLPMSGHLMDVVLTSAVMMEGAAAGMPPAAPGAPAGGSFPGGVDPNLDPELAMALRMSMEEERARQSSGPTTTTAGGPASTGAIPMDEDAAEDDDQLLQQAIAMSMAAGQEDDSHKDEEMPALAGSETGQQAEEDISDVLKDPDFIASLLDSAGVDKNDLQMEDILSEEKSDKDKSQDKGKGPDKKDDKGKPSSS